MLNYMLQQIKSNIRNFHTLRLEGGVFCFAFLLKKKKKENISTVVRLFSNLCAEDHWVLSLALALAPGVALGKPQQSN